MEIWSILLLAVGLAMDCFAVSLGIGSFGSVVSHRSFFRLAFHFGIFQGMMTLLGWLAGSTIVNVIASFDHWVAFILLAWVGARMIKESFHKEEDCGPSQDPSRGKTLIMLSIATSLDALAVGLSLALVDGSIWTAAAIIGVVSLVLSLVGLLLGSKLNNKFGKRMELLGGILLIGIGLRILLTHML